MELVALMLWRWWRRRRQRQRRAHLPGIPATTRRQVLARYGYHCLWCGTRYGLEIDHIRPRAAGGSNDLANLAVLCTLHNRIKSDYWPGRRYHPWPGCSNRRLARKILLRELELAA